MMREEKTVSYTTTNTYQTLNTFTQKTEVIWMVCHGLGHLTKYFLNHFEKLDPEKHYIIAPQAPSKYYQDKRYKYIGASWLTRENTDIEIENVLNYLDQVYTSEIQPKLNSRIKFCVMGFSQGVSVASRWISRRAISCDFFIVHSGSIPEDIDKDAFKKTMGFLTYGKEDPLLNSSRLKQQTSLAKELFDERLNILPFEGKHIVNDEILAEISKKL